MLDFLKFNTFIAQNILIFVYYIGVFLIPILLWKYQEYLPYRFLKLKKSSRVLALFIALSFCIEVCWRMFFEAMIGYFDMHDYLYTIQKSLH